MDGIINVNKPTGMTSHDVVYRLRRLLNIKKIGHTGTLDPDASGVLPMCVGKGTKLAELLTASDKQYLAELTLGAFTDTQDSSGSVLESFEVNVTEDEIRNAAAGLVGEIMQVPPMYSAIKMNGKKLYELAREGKTVERKARRVTVSNIEIMDINMENRTVKMLIDCSKGTYIRTLCNDIGVALGCGGYMSALTRTRSGRFSIDNSFTLERIEKMLETGDTGFFIPVSEALSEYPSVILADKNAQKVRYGIKISPQGLSEGETYRVFDEKNDFLALAKQENGRLVIVRSFFDGSQPRESQKAF